MHQVHVRATVDGTSLKEASVQGVRDLENVVNQHADVG